MWISAPKVDHTLRYLASQVSRIFQMMFGTRLIVTALAQRESKAQRNAWKKWRLVLTDDWRLVIVQSGDLRSSLRLSRSRRKQKPPFSFRLYERVVPNYWVASSLIMYLLPSSASGAFKFNLTWSSFQPASHSSPRLYFHLIVLASKAWNVRSTDRR